MKDVTPAHRPLRMLERDAILARFGQALTLHDGVVGAHCVHELWMRGEWPQTIDDALERLWKAAAASIPDWLPMRHVDWLPLVYEVTERFRPQRKGRTNVYLILLDYPDRRRAVHGVYVGMSRYTPSQRFDQHKAGIRAAGSVLKRGLEVLAGPTLHLQRMARADAARIERELAEALSDAGLLVEGGH